MKKKKNPALLMAALALAGLLLCSCGKNGRGEITIRIVNWNVQTFFDGNKDGIEYPNFLKSKKWNQDAYAARLQKLCKAIESLDADLVILEEIENIGVVHDISNALAGNNWNPSKVYRYACFAKEPGASIGSAALSRFPLQDLKSHSLCVQAEGLKAPSMRPLIEVDLLAPKRLKLFVNHWKSKSGAGDSGVWRRWQESLLAQKIIEAKRQDESAAILCAGDFNQDISEFSINREDSSVELRSPFCAQKVFVRSPWLDCESPIGSYNFRDKWERIDHFFCSGDLSLEDFGPRTGEWSYDDGRPIAFKIHSLNGWSDHLPISCKLTF